MTNSDEAAEALKTKALFGCIAGDCATEMSYHASHLAETGHGPVCEDCWGEDYGDVREGDERRWSELPPFDPFTPAFAAAEQRGRERGLEEGAKYYEARAARCEDDSGHRDPLGHLVKLGAERDRTTARELRALTKRGQG